MPAHHTKTVAKYKWGVKRRANRAIELVKELHERAPTLSHLGNQHRLASLLHCWFTRRILKDAAKESPIVRDHLASDPMYNLRTVRARFGTEWALAKEQADKERKEAPPNPLQHKTPKTTYRCYVALEDSDTSDEDVPAVEDEAEPETQPASQTDSAARTIAERRDAKLQTKQVTKLQRVTFAPGAASPSLARPRRTRRSREQTTTKA